MKTIEVNIYQFDELSDDAKNVSIEEYRQGMYNDNSFSYWAIDDCYLFEPKHEELISLCPEYGKMKEPMLGNTRKVYYDLDRNRHIDASNGIVVNNEKMFLQWLGIPDEMHYKIDYTIRATKIRYPDTIIEFQENYRDIEISDEERKILDYAECKFSDHMEDVLNRISEAYEYCFSDEYIAQNLEINDYEFTENGNRY